VILLCIGRVIKAFHDYIGGFGSLKVQSVIKDAVEIFNFLFSK